MTAPTRYMLSPEVVLTGPGCWHATSSVVEKFGRRTLALGDAAGLAAVTSLLESLEERRIAVQGRTFEGECTEAAIASVARGARGFDAMIGIGGGKAIDTAKAAAAAATIPCVTIPTSPATCAAYTPLSIIHDMRGGYIESRRLPTPVAAMILDPELMISAPARLLSAGCIDALARSWDTLLAARAGVPFSMAALSLAACRQIWDETLRPLSAQAIDDNLAGTVTPAFTAVVEACITGAGLAGQLGARFFGRSFSHALGYALAGFVDNAVVLHGEAVGLGVLLQCALDAESTVSLPDMAAYFRSWGAPTQFADLGFEGLEGERGQTLASATYDLLDLDAAVPFPVTAEEIHQGLLAVEEVNSA